LPEEVRRETAHREREQARDEGVDSVPAGFPETPDKTFAQATMLLPHHSAFIVYFPWACLAVELCCGARGSRGVPHV